MNLPKSLNTNKMYENIINKHLIKICRNIKDLNRAHYIVLINDTKEKRTRQQISMTIKQIVKSAVKDKLLPTSIMDKIFDNTIKIKKKVQTQR